MGVCFYVPYIFFRVPMEMVGWGSGSRCMQYCPFLTLDFKSKSMSILRDRYFLLCAAAAFILISSSFFWDSGDDNSGEAGIVRDVRESENGYVFSLEDCGGEEICCFSKTEPEEGGAYSVKGSWSDDGTMLFVSSMEPL